MKQPSALQSGDTIRILSTARRISKEELISAIRVFESWGLTVTLGKNLFSKHHQFAGNKEQRTRDLQEALDDDEVKAIVCARGGYGTVQLIDSLDFSRFVKTPKWLVGYSDVTVLHNHINQNFGIATLHATMPISFPKQGEDETTSTLYRALFGKTYALTFEPTSESILPKYEINAPIVGGNLSIIYSLTGTASQLETAGKLLFIEDLDEYLYHIDRMMMNLTRAGMFAHCKGVLVGGMSDMNDNTVPYGQTATEIIREQLNPYKIPLLFGFPAGHIQRNLAITMNREARLRIEKNQAMVMFHGST